MVYFHEWVHGTAAWLTGYKSHPFAIHYGEQWFTLWDIDEAVPYQKILADGRPSVMAFIAISPIVCQALVFILGLHLLKNLNIQKRRWLFALTYWFTFFELAEIYAYIPIRTFAPKGDVYNFLLTTELSPWIVAIAGTLFVIWGIYRMLVIEVPRACCCLHISSKAGYAAFLITTVCIFFGYYGGVGSWMPDPTSQMLTKISWIMVPITLIALYIRHRLTRKIRIK
jgi:hypothetical protein